MENNHSKKIFSTLLLAVGTLFVIVAGGIFVSSTWNYLPEAVKKLCLALVTAGCFGGAYFAENKWQLRKTSYALYYLGVCFLGYTGYSFLEWIGMRGLKRALITVGIMMVPVGLHFWKKVNLLDFLLEIVLLDIALVLSTALYECSHTDFSNFFVLCGSVITLLLSVVTYGCKRYLPEENGLSLTGCLAVCFHLLVMIPFIVYGIGDTNFLYAVLPSMMSLLSVTTLYAAYEKKAVLRVLQSVALVGVCFAIVAFVFAFFRQESPVSALLVTTLILSLICMVILDRPELYIGSGVFVSIATMCQMLVYLCEGAYREENRFFYPYAFCLVIALVAAKLMKKTGCEIMCNTKTIFIWGLYGINNLLSFASVEYCVRFSAWMYFAITMYLLAAVVCRRLPIIRELWKTLAVLFALCGIGLGTCEYLVFYEPDQVTVALNFATEYFCLIAAVGVVLLGVIWYDVCKEIRIIQFVFYCILLFVLLMNNLTGESLPNVLFLVTVSLIGLVVSSRLRKKGYAIAFGVTLVSVVLYLTRAFWLSIAWWVYLFVAGVGLILYAIKREKAE